MCLTVWLSRSECRKRSRITEGIRKLRSLDSPILTVGLIKFLGAKFVLDSGFGTLPSSSTLLLVPMRSGETPVPIPNTTVKT